MQECMSQMYCNLTLVSNVCKAVPISLFSATYGLNNLPEEHFKFPIILISKCTAFRFSCMHLCTHLWWSDDVCVVNLSHTWFS